MIKIIDYFLTDEDCDSLIELAKPQLHDATVLGAAIDGYRTAQTTFFHFSNEVIDKIKNLIAFESGIPIENQERISVIKYERGGEYKQHQDFFHPDTDYYDSEIKRGGQRTQTFLFYLNDNFYGGETDFPTKKITVTPKKRRALIWKNLNDDGTPDYESLHAGLPVLAGTKWIAVVWIRADKFE
jgi:prolyl 4-hydroxylase